MYFCLNLNILLSALYIDNLENSLEITLEKT